MSFAKRFPGVAKMLGQVDVDPRDEDEDEATGGEGADTSDENEGEDAPDGGDDADNDTETGGDNEGGSEAAASLADLSADDRSALQAAFTRDANALVTAAQTRCIAVFTSDAGQRAPNAAARLLTKTSMSATDIIDTLKDTGATSRAQDRARLRSSTEARPSTGAGSEPKAGSEAARDAAKERRKKRNKAVKDKGGVKANRTEFDVGDDD